MIDPSSLILFFDPRDRLRLTIAGDRSYPIVKPVWAAPLTHRGRWLALLDGKGDEIAMLDDPCALPKESEFAVREELRRRYLTAEVTAITHARQEFGATYWNVETDRGPRDLVTQNLQENVVRISEDHILLLDVDGNRFEVPDTSVLDARSRRYIETIL
jgi:hypothetical protein